MAPVTVLVTYRPKKGSERKLLTLVKRHWPTLSRARLVTSDRAHVWRATDKRTRRIYYVEMFTWKDSRASDVAHRTGEVLAIWEPMEPLLESMDIAVVRPLALSE